MSKYIAAIAISLVAGFALGAWVAADEVEPGRAGIEGIDTVAPSPSNSLDERLLSLEQLIAEEREARLIMEEQLQMLVLQIEGIDSAGSRANAAAAAEASSAERASERRSERNFASQMERYQDRRVRRMVSSGFTEEEARQVLRQESAAQFKALQVMHEAQRRGQSPDLLTTMNGPQSILRADLGDDAYARYLEAQGQPTAIQITQVLDGSPGSLAGLQPGDQMVSYNGERIFSIAELRSLTMQGTPGEDVHVEIDRDGVRMQLSLQRGPVGVTGSGANIRTMNWWGGG